MCYVPACNWDSGLNMMVLTFWLSRTLEMMQNDMRTSGIDVFLIYNWFFVHEELFMDVFGWEQRVWNSFALQMNVLCFLDVDEFKQNVFGIWMSFSHEFSTWTTSMSQTKLHVLFLEAAACFCDEFCLFCKWMRRCKCIWKWILTVEGEFNVWIHPVEDELVLDEKDTLFVSCRRPFC